MNAAVASFRPAALTALRGAAAVLLLGLTWEGLVIFFHINPYYLPRLSVILEAIAAVPDAYIAGFLRTLTETVMGFTMGALVGVFNGVIFQRSRLLKELIFPFLLFPRRSRSSPLVPWWCCGLATPSWPRP